MLFFDYVIQNIILKIFRGILDYIIHKQFSNLILDFELCNPEYI